MLEGGLGGVTELQAGSLTRATQRRGAQSRVELAADVEDALSHIPAKNHVDKH